MTWTATERESELSGGFATDIWDSNGQLFCCIYSAADDDEAIEQMRARARLIVQASTLWECLYSLFATTDLSDEGLRDYYDVDMADEDDCILCTIETWKLRKIVIALTAAAQGEPS